MPSCRKTFKGAEDTGSALKNCFWEFCYHFLWFVFITYIIRKTTPFYHCSWRPIYFQVHQFLSWQILTSAQITAMIVINLRLASILMVLSNAIVMRVTTVMESHAVVSLRTWWLTNANKKKCGTKIRLHLKTSNCKTNKYIKKRNKSLKKIGVKFACLCNSPSVSFSDNFMNFYFIIYVDRRGANFYRQVFTAVYINWQSMRCLLLLSQFCFRDATA